MQTYDIVVVAMCIKRSYSFLIFTRIYLFTYRLLSPLEELSNDHCLPIRVTFGIFPHTCHSFC